MPPDIVGNWKTHWLAYDGAYEKMRRCVCVFVIFWQKRHVLQGSQQGDCLRVEQVSRRPQTLEFQGFTL